MRITRLGQCYEIFDELSFDTNNGMAGGVVQRLHITRIPILLNIVKGDMSFVGPLPKAPTDLNALSPAFHDRYSVRPGTDFHLVDTNGGPTSITKLNSA